MSTFGERVRLLLLEKRISQAELARQVGTKQQTISYLVKSNGAAQTSRYCAQIANVLKVNSLWLQTGEGNKYDVSPSLPAPSGVTCMAIEIKEDSMLPVLKTGDLVIIYRKH
jgi:transcriptional regulator with XRE-family HTH domain